MPDEKQNGGAVLRERVANSVRKYSFNLYQSDVNALKELVSWGVAVNVTQALRSAIATEFFLRDAVRRGEHVFLESPETGRREIVLLGGPTAAAARQPAAAAGAGR